MNVSVSSSTSFGPGGNGGPGTYNSNEPLFASSSTSSCVNTHAPAEFSLLSAANLLEPNLGTSAGQNGLSSAAGGGANDPITGAEAQQAQRASADIQGTTDALSDEVGTLQARVTAPRAILEDITQPVKDYGSGMGKVFGGIGLKAVSDIKMKVPYNGRMTFIPKGIVARTANSLGVAAKWFGKVLGVANLLKHTNASVRNLRAGGGFLQGAHDAALAGSDIVGLVGRNATPARWMPTAAQSVDMSSEYWSGRFWNHIYGVE